MEEYRDLRGKVAVITGSTSGIGRAAAIALASHGVKVAVSGRDRERGEQVVAEIALAGGEAIFVQVDLLEARAPETLIEDTVRQWGRLDIVINNAALICHKEIDQVTHEDWDRLFAVNVKSGFFVMLQALPWLKKNGGSVINVSSINRLINVPNNIVYDTMKAALNHMGRGLSLEMRANGIRVNTIMPGGTDTPLLDEFFRQINVKNGTAEQIERPPNVASSRQIADVLVFLASDSSSWINGTEIPVDGGYFLG
jgi:3-oxoacyl-[acyl-carrier protein] reductase